MGTQGNPNLHNPQLDGDPFFWQAGPTGILLAHGYTATTAEIRPLAEKLRARGYTVSAPLLPGHGTSPEDLNRTTWQDWARAGQTALDQLFARCERVFVGGESMGGLLAIYLASQNPQAAGLLLYAPAIALNMGFVDYAKLYLGAPFISQVARASLDNGESWQGYPGLPLRGGIELLAFGKATRAQLSKIQQPVLIFQGRFDTTTAAQAGDLILKGVSSKTKMRYWMDKSHHTLTLDVELDEVAARTIEFIEKSG
ncbi:MAG: alpha/beta fold hydrolase [Anaerolineales bacterium]|jgi:carboxylesterase|nr:alpha/beta fold hydrolase [Anaerolineales bacterium]